jgi:hypothetical protein
VECNHYRVREDAMARLRVHAFTLTLDGFAAGTDQRVDAPFGDGVDGLHEWMFASFRGEGTGADHAVIVPILAGAGERLFEGLDALPAGYRVEALVPGESGNVHARVVHR